MSALEWKQVADISERSISLKNVDALCDLLQEARVDGLTERRQLIHVFNITQVLLNIRSEQWKNAEEILIQKTSELRNLQLENDDLEKENHELQRALSVSNTAREFVDEKLKLSTENERIRKEFDIMKFNMDQLTHEKTVLNTEKIELQKKVSEMHEEIQSLTSKCEYMHSKLQENPNVRELSEVKFRREISNLRSQVRLQKAEIDTLEEHKHNLECDVSRLEKNLREATADLEKATDEQLHLRSVMKEKDKCLARKIDECDALKKHLSKKSEDTDSGNDVILDAVDQKILEWKQVISEKDTEIVKLYEQIQTAQKQLKRASCDSTKFGIKTLLSTLSERDYQVNILKEQLADATKEVERSTRLLEEFKRQLDSTHGGSDETKAKRIKSLQIQLREKEVLTGRLEKSLRLAEETCQQQQVEITNLEQRLHRFECGEYGLAEALRELRAVKSQLESKDRQLEELCRVASQAETAVNETNLENEYLRERLGIKPDEAVDLKGYRMVKRTKDDEERALNIVLRIPPELQKPSPEPRDPFTLIGEQMVGKIAVLEMKELNERERAKHAQHMLNIMRQTNQQLEERNRELEQAVSRLTESSLSLQSSEHQLRQELADAVPRSVTCAMEKRVEELELANISLRHEMEQLKEIALISVFQTQNIEQQNKAHELEVETLRQQLEELESKDEHSAVVARLHRQVTGLQISESTAVCRLAATEKKAAHLESVILRVEQRLAKREAELREQRNYHDRWRKRYSETINTLRARYAGCVPIAEQERVASRYAEISRERARLQLELETAIQRAIKAEASLQGDRERNELVKHFKLVDDATDFGSSQKKESLERKLIQCQSKLADLRVEETIQRRQAEQLRLHNQHLQVVIHNQESQLNSLESENAQLSKQLERREIEWELRECELEKALYASKAAQQETVAATDKLGITEEVVTMAHSISETEANPFGDLQANRMPNAELPVSEQLKEALTIIKRNVLTILNQRVEIESLKKKLAELIREMQFNKEDIGLQSLPYQIPEKDYQTPTETDADNPATGSLRLQIDLLQRRLAAKEESLAEAHELLRQVEKANEDMQEKFTKQNADLLSRLRGRIEESVAQLSRSVESTASRQQADQYCKQLNQRLKEMEEALEEQHQVVIRQLDRTKQANRETEMWKMKYEQLGQEAEAARHKITEQYKRLFSQLQLDRENLQAQLNHCNKRVRELSSEVSKWKQEASKSPSAAQRQTTERLKAELADREKRQQALTKALAELRRDLLAQAEHAVLINAPTNKLSSVEGVRAPSMVDKSVEAVVTPAVQSGFPEHVVAVREESDLQQVPSSDIHSLLKQRNEQLEAECNELRGQLTRMKQIRTLRNDSSMNRQLQEMEEKNRDLENQIKRLQSSREKQRTETMRKLEAEVVSLNSQLASKIAELQRAQRQLEEIRIALESALRENELLRGRLSHNWQPAMLPEKEDLDALEKRKASVKPGELKERLALHQQVLELKSEVEMLRRAKPISLDLPVETKPVTGGPVELEAAELRHRLAQERIKALEQQLIDTGRSTPARIQMDQAIQQDLLRVTKENMELRSELETTRADIPRLKMRIQELQSYVERMRHENGTFATSRQNDKSIESGGNGNYNIKRVGESGKSCKELEKIIVRLKSVLQRSLAENERLKSTPSATVQNENRQLQAENERLRMELEQAKLAADALMTTHRASSEKSIQKLSQEYERLRKSYEEVGSS
ncbi:unnamed protein product [Dicrocoelium dendriticum]|nr:unnamed protein product [Dicrocoelium dendriticum]